MQTNKFKCHPDFAVKGSSMSPRFIIAGGGTGGHIFPAIAIANALKNIDANIEILFVGALGKMEMEKVPQAGYAIKGLPIAGFNRTSLLKNISLPFKLIKSFWEVRKIVKEFKPTAAIGVGGYSSFPVLKFCQSKGIKTFIHESNSFAGKSNILLGKNAIKVFVVSEGMEKFFPKNKIVITGNPVRKSITNNTITKDEAIRFFGLDANKKTILSIGGSLGAKSINEALADGIDKFVSHNIQLIWQTGKSTAEQFTGKAKNKDGVWANAFIERMEMAYAAADIVISRSGAMSVAEICVAKKPVVFVPYPFAAEDHQTANAMNLVEKNAAVLIKDENVKMDLVNTAIALTDNISAQQTMQSAITKFAITNADEVIANEILKNVSL